MRAIKTIAAAVAMFVAAPTAHNGSSAYRTAIGNLGNEVNECAAYFLVLSRFLGTTQAGPPGARQAAEASRMMLERALGLGALLGQKGEGVTARYHANVASIEKATGGDGKALFDRYAVSCLEIANNPFLHMDAWLQKAGALK